MVPQCKGGIIFFSAVPYPLIHTRVCCVTCLSLLHSCGESFFVEQPYNSYQQSTDVVHFINVFHDYHGCSSGMGK
jgi:hypothetical protein